MICRFKNGLCDGKGKFYDKNDNIKLEADFIKDNFEGNVKIFVDNSNYIIGQIRNYKFEGKIQLVLMGGKSILEGEIIWKKFLVENWKIVLEEGKYILLPYKNNDIKIEEARVFDEKGNILNEEIGKVFREKGGVHKEMIEGLLFVLLKKLKEDRKCIIC